MRNVVSLCSLTSMKPNPSAMSLEKRGRVERLPLQFPADTQTPARVRE
jgi:hypothetical protein